MSLHLRLLGTVVALMTAACGAAAPQEADAGDRRVMATTSILGDLVGGVLGDDVALEVLVPPGQDPHGFAPSAQQVQALRQADLVVANGLQLEEGLLDVLAEAEADGVPVLRLADHLDPITPAGASDRDEHAADDDHADEDDDHDHGPLDPHIWYDPLRMADGIRLVASTLQELAIEPADVDWHERGEQVASDLESLHAEVGEILGEVPEDCRRLLANHDSLGYLAARYDFEVVGSVSPGTSSQAEPSAREFAALAELVRRTEVPAVFVEVGQSTRLADALATEVDRDVDVVELYTGSLGEPGSGAEDYAGMLTTDAGRIADALSDC